MLGVTEKFKTSIWRRTLKRSPTSECNTHQMWCHLTEACILHMVGVIFYITLTHVTSQVYTEAELADEVIYFDHALKIFGI